MLSFCVLKQVVYIVTIKFQRFKFSLNLPYDEQSDDVEVLTAMSMNITLFRDVTGFDIQRHFGRMYCFHPQGRREVKVGQNVPPKRR
jgi:hypothetical protein